MAGAHVLLVAGSVDAAAVAQLRALAAEGGGAVEVRGECSLATADLQRIDGPEVALLCTAADVALLRQAGDAPTQLTVIVYHGDADADDECALMQAGRDSLEMVLDPELWIGGGVETDVDDVEETEDQKAYRVDGHLHVGSFKALAAGWDGAALSLLTAKEQDVLLGGELACAQHEVVRLRDDEADPDELLTALHTAVGFVEAQAAAGRDVLVHCVAGVSRAPSVATAYLMKAKGLSLAQALGAVKEARPWVQPNASFLRCLEQYEAVLKDRAGVAAGAPTGRTRLPFSTSFSAPIAEGKKRATTRLDTHLVKGDVVAAVDDDGRTFAWLVVTAITRTTFGALDDELAVEENLRTGDELRTVLLKYYPDSVAGTQVAVIYFSVVVLP